MIHYLIRLITQKLKTNQKGGTPMNDQESLQKVEQNELSDLLENIGVLQEINRTFLNPLGLNLILNQDFSLALQKTEDPEGIILHTVDLFKLKTFNNFRNKKHKTRQEKTGFVIQTTDLIRKEKLIENKELKLASPASLKLNFLLHCVDEATFNIKKRLMEKSSIFDKEFFDIDFPMLDITIRKDITEDNYIDTAAKAIILMYQEHIEKELIKIKEIKKEQDKVFKEDK